MKHNEYLCPQVERQLDEVLNCFLKHAQAAYDIQGINDRGVDVLLKYADEDAEFRYLGFQLKSFDDLKTPRYLKELRSQCYQAQVAFGELLEHYFIVLCTDVKVHHGKIREVKNAFAKDELVTVIDPAYALSFLKLSSTRIAAVVEAMLRDDDVVLKGARQVVDRLTPTEVAVLLQIAAQGILEPTPSCDVGQLAQSEFVLSAYSTFPDMPRDQYFMDYDEGGDMDGGDGDEETDLLAAVSRGRETQVRLAEDLDVLLNASVSTTETGSFVAEPSYVRPLQALLLDSLVRYENSEHDALSQVFDMLDVVRSFPILADLDL
jgi:hypothetical protein